MKTLGQQDNSRAILTFRSNVTPEITMDLTTLIVPSSAPPPNEAVQGTSKIALELIKPEVVVNAYNMQKSVAPYGQPTAGMYVYILGGLAGAGLMGALITFIICRYKPKPQYLIAMMTIIVGALIALYNRDTLLQ